MAFPIPQPLPAVTQTTAAHRPVPIRSFDVTWNRPIFRAPALPVQNHIWSEVPFTAQFPLRSFQGKAKA